MNEKDILCLQYLELLYQDVDGHHKAKYQNNMPIATTYGEILYPGIDKLIAAVPFTEQDVFADYGSGVGKIVMQVFLKTLVKEAIGIELLPALHEQAVFAKERVRKELPDFFADNRKLSFIAGDFLTTQLRDVTIALICSPCFTQAFLNKVGSIFDNTATIHTVFTLRPIETIKRLTLRKTVRIEGSWDTTLCYIYQSS